MRASLMTRSYYQSLESCFRQLLLTGVAVEKGLCGIGK
jgi:hypothetical protein